MNKNKKRILYFIQLPPPIYGVTKVNKLVFVSKEINKNIVKSLISLNYSKSLSELKKIKLGKFFSLILTWWNLFFKLLRFKPQYVYYTPPLIGIGFYKEIPNILLMKLFRVKPIYHLHGKGIANKINSNFQKRIYQYCFSNSILIHLSKGLYNSDFKDLDLKNTKVFFVANGIELIETKQNSKEKSTIELLFLSNIQRSKGIFLLLEVFLKITDKYKNVNLNIIGGFRDIETESSFLSFIKDNKIETKIKFWGTNYGYKKHQIISNCDILVHPTFNDAFPLVILEAMSHSLAIIGSDQGAIPEIINSEFGIIFPTGDKKELYKSLIELIENKEKRERMQQNAKQFFLKNYTLNHFETEMANIFSKL